jgi:hypothetical protein
MSLKRDEDYDELPPAKKRHVSDDAVFDDIDPLALDKILAFLDVKSLFRFSFSSKRFGQIVTHEHVVRSALISGGHAKRTASEIIELALKRKTLYLPTPLRLLRLVNGKTCETENCTALVKHIRPGYGLFFCWSCLVSRTVEFKINHRFLQNERVARNEYSKKAYVLIMPYSDTASERAGPILSSAAANEDDSVIASLLKEADAMWPQKLKERVLLCLEQAMEDREVIEKQSREQKKIRMDGKMIKAKKLAETLKELVSKTCPYKDIICSYQECFDLQNQKATITFVCRFVDIQMRTLIVAPSKATRKKMKEIAAFVEASAEIIKSSGFLDFSFLEGDKSVSRWESALQRHLRESIQPEVVLKLIDMSALTNITQGNLFDALKWLERSTVLYEKWAKPFADVITDSIPITLSEWGAHSVAVMVYRDVVCTKTDEETEWTKVCDEAAAEFWTLFPKAVEFSNRLVEQSRTEYPDDESKQVEFIRTMMDKLRSTHR